LKFGREWIRIKQVIEFCANCFDHQNPNGCLKSPTGREKNDECRVGRGKGEEKGR
jgi:hypothetical protein